ncbi:MAG TPA: DUF4397 domain-containing protein [Gemmatimonadaceae bacterium]|nr:DUF4397 domain-containing protein [Gemmatimonadaceae bacterium]
MHSIPRILALAAVIGSAACGDAGMGTVGVLPGTGGALRAINASSVPVKVSVDGQVRVTALPISGVSDTFSVASGTHTITYATTAGTNATSTTVNVVDGQQYATFAFSPSATALASAAIADTGAIVPANKSKLRVTNLAPNLGTNEIRRTQPDFGSPVQIQFPFPYQATSPYLQSDPGTWEVFVTPAGGGAKLATSGAIDIPAGQRRTVVLLDSAGTLRFKVFE